MKKLLLCIMILLTVSQNVVANEQIVLKNHFLDNIEKVITIVKDKSLDKVQRNSKIVQTLTPMFDFTLMAKLSLGKVWKQLSKKDQNKFVTLYVERMKQSYSSKIDAYSDEKVEVTQIKQCKSNKIELITNLVSKENKLEVSYKFYKPKNLKMDKDRWLIYDVVIVGVSILKTDKAQFREFLQTKSIQELMTQIKL